MVRLIVDQKRPGRFGRTWERLVAACGLREPLESQASEHMPGWREILVVSAGLAAAIGVVLHKQLADWYGVPDLGDPLFSMWRMGWVAHQLVADPAHLFDANIFYPDRGTLTYSDSMLLPALMAAPLIWMGVPLPVAYTTLFLLAWLAAGVATYLLARALTLSKGASWVAALVFALCQYRFEHYSHLELQMTLWMPLTLLAAHRLLATGRPRYAVYLMLALGAQWYSSMYYGVFLTIYAGVFVCVLTLAGRLGWGRFAMAITGLLLGVGLALPLARVYESTEEVRGTRNPGVVESYSARPADYLHPNLRSAVPRLVRHEEQG